jgi:hypothetical protein
MTLAKGTLSSISQMLWAMLKTVLRFAVLFPFEIPGISVGRTVSVGDVATAVDWGSEGACSAANTDSVFGGALGGTVPTSTISSCVESVETEGKTEEEGVLR